MKRGERDLQAVERASQAVHSSRNRKHGRAESTAHQVSSVSADVSTLVVRVDSQVKTHHLEEVLVLAEAKLIGEVERVVLVLLDWRHFAIFVDVSVDSSSNCRELGNNIHRILKGVAPVFRLLHPLGVGFGEGRLVLKGCDGERELSHWVEIAWAAVNELGDELGDVCAGSPFSGEVANLLLTWYLAGQEKPEETYLLSVLNSDEGQLFVEPSGRGSVPPGALGRSSRHSGMVFPRNRMPSTGSRTDPSQTNDLMPRAPP